tara:strand:+ start:10006 stop:10548 length:543 start_codon:yes stop_codon:yes gene_type:complete
MAAKHILSLDSSLVSNCEILHLKDTSQYAPNLEVDCAELLITAPGFSSALVETGPGFDLQITACSLNLQTTACNEDRVSLPDGVYVVRYSVSPNEKVFVEYNILRTTHLMDLFYEKMVDIDVSPCEPSSDKKEVMDQMSLIRTYIDAAKAKVEYAANPTQGMELYDFAKRKLEKITCKTC